MESDYSWLGNYIPLTDEDEDKEFIDNLISIRTDSSGTIISISVD